MTDTTNLLNVITVDDRNGNHYWICDVYHVTGTDTEVLVPDSVLSAAQIPDGAANGGSVTIDDDVTTDSTKEVVVASAIATGLVKLIIRFSGSAAGMGSGHGVL
jgi:hypothetical protein